MTTSDAVTSQANQSGPHRKDDAVQCQKCGDRGRWHLPSGSCGLCDLCPGWEHPDANRINRLAALIREVDGKHDMGAAALAEALVAKGVRL